MAKITVVVPTHDQGELLRYSIGSVLGQTIQDFELFVIGDGVSPETRDVIRKLAAADRRIRFFDNAKGERHGELYRHQALAEASGEIVCYLCDDDLWLPRHLEYMGELLAKNDFAHSLAVRLDDAGEVSINCGDLAIAEFRARLLSGRNFIPLSTAGHTLECYRRLPFGWRPAPKEVFSDLFMWQQILACSPLRAESGKRFTVLNFPSPWRRTQSLAERKNELESWYAKLAAPNIESSLGDSVGKFLLKEWTFGNIKDGRAELEAALLRETRRAAELQRQLELRHEGIMRRLKRQALNMPLIGPMLRAGLSRLSRSSARQDPEGLRLG